MTDFKNKVDMLWDDDPIDVSAEANFIWSIANKLRGTYMPDKYGDVIIPMTILRRFECALAPKKNEVIVAYENNPNLPSQALEKISGFQFYNYSHYDLKELQNETDKLADNFINYIEGFSSNVQDIMKQLKLADHIKTMDEGGCLLTVVKAFSELDLNPATYDSIKMGYIFENLIGRFYQNVDAGQYYTGRDIIKCLVAILTAEGSDDIFEDHKVITVCDQACGTGGMLSTAYSYLKRVNPSADIRLFGQEYMGPSYAIGLAEMLIKGQDSKNFRHADTFKEDCFKGTKMRFVIENPPFGTPWAGKVLTEKQYQRYIIDYLVENNGYIERTDANFDRYYAIDKELLLQFLCDTQLDEVIKLKKIYKDKFEETLINVINNQITSSKSSLLETLKHGVELSNTKLTLMYTKPATSFNRYF